MIALGENKPFKLCTQKNVIQISQIVPRTLDRLLIIGNLLKEYHTENNSLKMFTPIRNLYTCFVYWNS